MIKWLKARFRRRSTHVPNLTDEISPAKERRLNQFGTAVLIRCGRNAKLDRVCRIIRHWIDWWFIRRSSQVPNLMHTLCLHYIYNFSHNTARVYAVAMRGTLHREKLREKWRVKKNNLAPLALRVQNIRCQEYFCMPCSVFENDETVKGWKAGSSVAYCEPCFREVVEEHAEKVEYNNSNESGKKRSTEARRSSTKRKSIMALKYGIGPRHFSFAAHEIKVRINTRYAVWI